MAAYVARCCESLSGRRHGEALLDDVADDRGRGSAMVAAERGLRQVSDLRQRCDALGPLVRAAFPTGTGSGAIALATIRAHICELEAMFETEIAARRPRQVQPRRRLQYDCIVKEGVNTVWHPRRFLLGGAGFCLEDQEGPASAGDEQPWEDITSIDAGDHETHLHEAVLILRRSPGYLHIRFFDAYPLRSLQEHWTACARSSFAGATVPAVIDPLTQAWMNDLSCLVEGLRSRRGQPAIATQSVNTMPLSNLGATPPKVYDQILRDDSECTILKVWRANNASELVASPWETLEGSGGHLRGIRFRMPLKPRPMAPKSSRFVVAYHLSGPDERPIVLTEISRTLDVPYSSSFEVHNQHVFRELPPEESASECQRCAPGARPKSGGRGRARRAAFCWRTRLASTGRDGA